MSEAPSIDDFLAIPRLHNLYLSPGGERLALTVQSVAADGRSFESAIWQVPLLGDEPPRRLSREGSDETARGFTPDGSLLFSKPMTVEGSEGDEPTGEGAGHAAMAGASDRPHALYVLPADGLPARRLLAPAAGIGDVLTARGATTVVVTARMHPGAASLADDAAHEQARKDAGVQARLVDHYPDRYWDHDLGPRQPRLLALDVSGGGHGTSDGRPIDLTPAPPWAGWMEEVHLSLSEDGAQVAFGAEPNTGRHFKVDLATVATDGEGVVRTLIDAEVNHAAVAWSPDGSTIAVAAIEIGTPDQATRFHLRLVDAATGAVRDVAQQWDALALEVVWARDGESLLVTADQRGHTPVFRVGLDNSVTRLTAAGAYSNLALSADGATLYAIRSHVNAVPVPVALDVSAADQEPLVLASPIPAEVLATRLEEVTTEGLDGATVHSWLVLPELAAQAPLPLAVLIHGGPISSWAGWHWRWSAPLLAAQGWAVLLPNPRLSTGYGHDHIAAAWSDWATLPAGDILAATEAVSARADVDGNRVAALGGSYGGYMANWLAVTTSRFRAIVTHASVWDLELERNTSDVGLSMDHEFGDPGREGDAWRRQSPSLRADSLHTPMLVIHGARDQRVPLANSHSLWLALQQRSVPSRLLVYPDENHWVLKPQNARLWYQTVLAFLDQNVLERDWRRPPLV